ELEKSVARERIETELTAAFQKVYAELRQKFHLTADDLPHRPRERMRCSRPALSGRMATERGGYTKIARFRASTVDFGMCMAMNLLQSRHRLNGTSAQEMERSITRHERLTAQEYYAAPQDIALGRIAEGGSRTTVTWPSPVKTDFPRNDVARADFFWCSRGKAAPTVFMLHALMSATHIGYR